MLGEYIKIYVLGSVFVEISLGMNAFITAQGFSSVAMKTVLVGAVSNIVLDPIFIFVFSMGAKGAALATVISQGFSAVWVLVFMLGKKPVLKLRKENLIPDLPVLLPCMALDFRRSSCRRPKVCFRSALTHRSKNTAAM